MVLVRNGLERCPPVSLRAGVSFLQCDLLGVLHARVLDHFAAGSSALLAFVSTLFHVLVIGELRARLTALIASLRTRIADQR